MTDADIRFERRRTTAIAYAVLARLDLGLDAATLFDPRLDTPAWGPALRRAYLAAPGRLVLQGAPLWLGDDLGPRLRDDPPAGLRDPAGRTLARRFADALDDLGDLDIGWSSPPEHLVPTWRTLRAALWHDAPAPAWSILDCPALGNAGRATRTGGAQVIAVSLAADDEHIACQVFHEAVHAISDPIVLGDAAPSRSTRAGDPGHALHLALEKTAVEVGGAIIEARAPAWTDAYARWCARVGG
jgi:hypothetical protein